MRVTRRALKGTAGARSCFSNAEPGGRTGSAVGLRVAFGEREASAHATWRSMRSDQRAQRKPMKTVATKPGGASRTASGPTKTAPPRSSAPGKFDVVLAPARYMSSLLALAQPGQFVEFGTQSATHSARLPTMSKVPRAETQPLRAPVRDGEPS